MEVLEQTLSVESADASTVDHVPQGATRDFALEGLAMLEQVHGVAADPLQIRHASGFGDQPFDEFSLLRAARNFGLKARVIRQPLDRVDRVALPALALRDDGASVGHDAIKDEKPGLIFPARVRQALQSMYIDGTDISVTPDMAVSLDVMTGKRTVLDYLLEPVKVNLSESLHER
jgi:ABC-type bacteriocin/lantibiotic exporter with double-glycine peptidase domain